MTKRLLTGLAAAAIATLPLAGASAQGNSHCGGIVQVERFYSTTQSTGTRSIVSYFVVVQNMVAQPLFIEVTFRDPKNIVVPGGTPGGGGPHGRRLAPRATSEPIQIGVAPLANPAGTGGLNVPTDLAAGTTITCRTLARSGS